MKKNRVDEITYNGRTFYILKDEHGYWGIESNLFKDGVLQKEVNGLFGHLSDTMEECKRKVINQIKIDKFVSQGLTVLDASLKVITENN